MAQATLGGGCFWCLEPVYEALVGVERVTVGYAGGTTENPTYHEVGGGRTGHAEVVQIDFDPELITYEQILQVFFSVHDPTTPNRQGADVGSQYRSLILTHDASQEQIARNVIEQMEVEGVWRNPIVTEIASFKEYYLAEDYHQDYYENNPGAGYCVAVINPKLHKFRKQFAEQLKQPATT